jgi:hypothetical protein
VHDKISNTHQSDARSARQQAARLHLWARIVLVPVAVIGAVLSFRSLYTAAAVVFGTQLALGFPLLVDFLILGASLQYVAGAKVGHGRAGWRLTAHAGVAGTLVLNALAARSLAEVPWHVTAPAVWSVLVELTAREVLGQWRATHMQLGERIPARLWWTAPVESLRTWLRMARRVDGEQAAARLDVGVHAAAVEALKLALPQRRARRVRKILQRQLRAGSLPPAAILGPLGWTDDVIALAEVTPQAVLRAALRDALAPALPSATPATTAPSNDTPDVAGPDPGQEETPGPKDTAPGTGAIAGPPSAAVPDRVVAAAEATHITTVIDVTDSATATPIQAAPDLSTTRQQVADPVPFTAVASSGDRLADTIDLLQGNANLTARELAAQLRALGWSLSNSTAARMLSKARARLQEDTRFSTVG